VSWRPTPTEALHHAAPPSLAARLRARVGVLPVAGASVVGGSVVGAVLAHALGW